MSHRVRFLITGLLLLLTWLLLKDAAGHAVSISRPLAEFPALLQEWKMASQEFFDASVLKLLKPTDYLSRRYQSSDGRTVHLYVGYHNGAIDSGEIHSPRHCLPGTGWQQISTARATISTAVGDIHAVRAVYQKGGARELFYYWFQSRGRTIDNELALKFSAVTGALIHGRRDAGFVRISIPFEADEKSADASVTSFISILYPELCRFLPGRNVRLPDNA